MENTADQSPPATNNADELRKARSERYEAIKTMIEDLDKVCAETRKIIYDLRNLMRQYAGPVRRRDAPGRKRGVESARRGWGSPAHRRSAARRSSHRARRPAQSEPAS